MRRDIEQMIDKENAKQTEVERLSEEYRRLKEQNFQFAQQASSFNTIFEHVNTLKQRKEMFESHRDTILEGTTILNGELFVCTPIANSARRDRGPKAAVSEL